MNNELLIKNHQSRPNGSATFSKVNAAFSKNYRREYNHGRGRGRGRGRDHFYNPSQNHAIHKKYHVERHDKGKDVHESSLWNPKDSCCKCGSKGHWSRVCKTPEHLCKFYKASLKGKEKKVNFIEHVDPMDDSISTHRDFMDTGNY